MQCLQLGHNAGGYCSDHLVNIRKRKLSEHASNTANNYQDSRKEENRPGKENIQ